MIAEHVLLFDSLNVADEMECSGTGSQSLMAIPSLSQKNGLEK